MQVSRSGYYKWKANPKENKDNIRKKIIPVVVEVHEAHPSHGYRWVHAFIVQNYKIKVSEGLIYKVFDYLGLKSETKHKPHYKKRKEKDKFPNLVLSTWDTLDRPRQVIVSDMTVIEFRYYFYYEVTFYFDAFTKQMLTYRVAARRGDRMQYIDGLKDVIEILKEEGCDKPTILHTDQGSVYASLPFNVIVKDSNIIRSMSRAGTPTDNPVNESLNGWIKEELFVDFHIDKAEDPLKVLAEYMVYYNEKRP